MTIQQLSDLTQKAYNKQKVASKKGNKTSTLLNLVTKDSSLALDDTRLHHHTRVLQQEHRECDPPMSTTAISPTAEKSMGPGTLLKKPKRYEQLETIGTRHQKVIA